MAFTDHSDLYGAIHEDGINLVVRHIMRQRPSLFNYGTAFVAQNPGLLCVKIDPAPAVIQRGNPLITIVDPLPILGTDNPVIGLNFCVQLTKAELDFHPGNVITLPPEASPPLAAQRFALHIQACGGLGCPPKDFLDRFQPPAQEDSDKPFFSTAAPRERPKLPPIVLPSRELLCFCIDLFAVGHVEVTGPVGKQKLQGKLDALEIVDIRPQGLEDSMECYLKLLIQLVVLPKTAIALKKMVFEVLDLGSITLSPATTVPNNPAIEEDQLKVFVDVEV